MSLIPGKNTKKTSSQDNTDDLDVSCSMKEENRVIEKKDKQGNIWKKAYFGSGSHFNHWLAQYIEIYGKENIEVEEYMSSELNCFSGGSEALKRIWVKQKK